MPCCHLFFFFFEVFSVGGPAVRFCSRGPPQAQAVRPPDRPTSVIGVVGWIGLCRTYTPVFRERESGLLPGCGETCRRRTVCCSGPTLAVKC